MYDHRLMRLALRKKVETRKWKLSKTFANYFQEKIILANAVQIDEDETINYLIEESLMIIYKISQQ